MVQIFQRKGGYTMKLRNNIYDHTLASKGKKVIYKTRGTINHSPTLEILSKRLISSQFTVPFVANTRFLLHCVLYCECRCSYNRSNGWKT